MLCTQGSPIQIFYTSNFPVLISVAKVKSPKKLGVISRARKGKSHFAQHVAPVVLLMLLQIRKKAIFVKRQGASSYDRKNIPDIVCCTNIP